MIKGEVVNTPQKNIYLPDGLYASLVYLSLEKNLALNDLIRLALEFALKTKREEFVKSLRQEEQRDE